MEYGSHLNFNNEWNVWNVVLANLQRQSIYTAKMGKHRPRKELAEELKKIKAVNGLLIDRLKRKQSLEETTAESSATSSHERHHRSLLISI